MSRDKQISEMAKVIYGRPSYDTFYQSNCEYLATDLYDAGYRKQSEWISAEDRLPTNEKNVLCYYGFDRGDGDLGMMFMGTLSYFCFDPNPHWQHADHNLVVTHWMPLPEPPEMKGADDEQR